MTQLLLIDKEIKEYDVFLKSLSNTTILIEYNNNNVAIFTEEFNNIT